MSGTSYLNELIKQLQVETNVEAQSQAGEKASEGKTGVVEDNKQSTVTCMHSTECVKNRKHLVHSLERNLNAHTYFLWTLESDMKKTKKAFI